MMFILQGSFYVRNIMIQPVPLTLPPKRRSLDSPSFRLIDFGWAERLEVAAREAKGEELVGLMNDFYPAQVNELRRARRARGELAMEDRVLGV